MLSAFAFHHVGIACFDIDKTSVYYVAMGYQKTETIIDPLQNVKVCVLRKSEMPTIELLEPVDEKSPICGILKNKGGVSPYHICYQIPDMDMSIMELRGMGFIPTSGPPKKSNVFSRKVCFLYHKSMGIIELIER